MSGELDPIDHDATGKHGIHETTHHKTSHLTEKCVNLDLIYSTTAETFHIFS